MSTSTKRVPHGQSKYIQGNFYSEKNDSTFPYKSSYELAYLEKIEKSNKVLKYLYEPFEVGYVDYYNKNRMYRPDFMVLHEDGSILITEIKPEAMLEDFDVQAKAKAAEVFIKEKYKGLDIKYKFITEKNLFKDIGDYTKFIKRIKEK